MRELSAQAESEGYEACLTASPVPTPTQTSGAFAEGRGGAAESEGYEACSDEVSREFCPPLCFIDSKLK